MYRTMVDHLVFFSESDASWTLYKNEPETRIEKIRKEGILPVQVGRGKTRRLGSCERIWERD